MERIYTTLLLLISNFLFSQKTDTFILANQEYQSVLIESLIPGIHRYKVSFKSYLKADSIIKDWMSVDTIVLQNESKNLDEFQIRYVPAYKKYFPTLLT